MQPLPSERVRAKLNEEQRALLDWIYEGSRNPAFATVILGFCSAYAADHQQASFWECLAEAQGTIAVHRFGQG